VKESELFTQVIQTCNWYGLRHYDSEHSATGFPNLVIVGPDGMLFVEVKGSKGVLSHQQVKWIAELRAAGAEAMVVRPHDFDDLVLQLKRIAGK
jgi:hypothetical protein